MKKFLKATALLIAGAAAGVVGLVAIVRYSLAVEPTLEDEARGQEALAHRIASLGKSKPSAE